MKTLKLNFASILLATAIGLGGIAGLDPSGITAVAAAQAKGMDAQSDLRLALNQLLAEHVGLAAAATDAALGGRTKEFKAAAAALDANSQDIAKAIGSVYGQAAGDAFLPLWRKHIGFFVDYTMATAKGNKKGQDKAVNDLVQYAQDFGAFINSASPGLPKEAVAGLVKMHALGLKAVIDAQATHNETLAFEKLREATHHMQMIADPLAATIVAQFPDKFPAM